MDVARVRFAELRRLEEELETTRRSLIERKTVDRAKGVLMDERGMSGQAAYNALRKLAMDQNQRVGAVARYITRAPNFRVADGPSVQRFLPVDRAGCIQADARPGLPERSRKPYPSSSEPPRSRAPDIARNSTMQQAAPGPKTVGRYTAHFAP